MSDNPKILGINVRYFPTQASAVGHASIQMPKELQDEFGEDFTDQSETPPPTLAVLVEGDIGDYACYVGHGKPEWVAKFGDKISFEEACCNFPGGQLKKELYRER